MKISKRNIYIIGAQSTGKTTLINALARTFDGDLKPVIIREVARTVLREKDYTRDDILNSPVRALELQRLILDGQLAAEEAAEEAAGTNTSTWVISDRSGLDPVVYATVFVGEGPAEQLMASQAWHKLEARMKAGLVVLCEAGCEWLEDDGIRLMPAGLEEWMRLDGVFRKLLDMRNIEFVVCGKHVSELAERVELVKRHIRTLKQA